MGIDNSASLAPVSIPTFEHRPPSPEKKIINILQQADNRPPSETLRAIVALESNPVITPSEKNQSQTQLNNPLESDQEKIDQVQKEIRVLSSPKPENGQSMEMPTLLETYQKQNQSSSLVEKVVVNIEQVRTIKKLKKMGVTDAGNYYKDFSDRGVFSDQILKYVPKFVELNLSSEQAVIVLERMAQLNYYSFGEKMYPNIQACHLAPELLKVSDQDFLERLSELKNYPFLIVGLSSDDKDATISFLKNGLNETEKKYLDQIKKLYLLQHPHQRDFLQDKYFKTFYGSLFNAQKKEGFEEKINNLPKIIDRLNNFFDTNNKISEINTFLAERMSYYVNAGYYNCSDCVSQLISNHYSEEFLQDIISTDKPISSDFFINYFKDHPFANLPDKFLSSLLPGDQKFWKLIGEGKGNIDQIISEKHDQIISLLNQKDTSPTSLVLKKIILKTFLKDGSFYKFTPELIQNFAPEDQKFWTNILNLKSVDSYSGAPITPINFIFEKDSYLTAEGKLTPQFFDDYLKNGSFNIDFIKFVLTPELIKTFSAEDQKLWQTAFLLASEINDQSSYGLIYQNRELIFQGINTSSNPQETLQQYISIFKQINTSPSKEILKIRNLLLPEILNATNPLEAYQKISDIFIKNNLPTIGKIYKVFNILYPPETINSKLASRRLSHVLTNNHSQRFRQSIIFNDLLKTNLQSGEPSLVNYFNLFESSSPLLEKARLRESLTPTESAQLTAFFRKLDTIYDSSLLSQIQSTESLDTSNLQSKISELYQKYKVKDGQSISDRVAQMYLSGLGIRSISDGLNYIKQSRESAHQRNLIRTDFSLAPGDLVKGVEPRNLDKILNFGCIAREYLGSDAGSDATPFDTDTIRSSASYPAKEILSVAARGYGGLFLVIKDRGQFQDTTNISNPKYDPNKLEIFNSGVVNNNHYGVRTGFSSSEIDFIILDKSINGSSRQLENIFYEIAKHGVYIPVLDQEGNQIFDPKSYQKYRRAFDGVKEFNGSPINVELSTPDNWSYQMIQETKQTINESNKTIQQQDQEIREKIKLILNSVNINLKDKFDSSLLGCRLENIGSSGRGTNLPNDFDFDYNLILDGPSQTQASKIKELILSNFQHSPGKPTNDPNQIRMTNVVNVGENPVELDIGVNSVADTLIFSSSEAIEQKLESIRSINGENAYQEVIANILLAKKILKENHAYKKGDYEDGGLGGIGVENWILANNGSVSKAFKTFWQASHDGDKVISLGDFRGNYPLFDAGENLRQTSREHDNFSYILTEKGYQAMIQTIKKYLKI